MRESEETGYYNWHKTLMFRRMRDAEYGGERRKINRWMKGRGGGGGWELGRKNVKERQTREKERTG